MSATIQISYENDTTSAIGVVGGVRLGNDQFNAYRGAVKAGRGARFSGAPRYVWLVPHDSVGKVVQGLQTSGFAVAMDERMRSQLSASIETNKADAEARAAAAESDAMSALARIRSTLSEHGMRLFDHQSFGIRWLASIERGLLADEMGLGKTLQVVAAIRTCGVIIAPSVAKGVWLQEIKRFRPDLRVTVLKKRGSFRWPEQGEVVVTNYEILPAPPEGAKQDALLVYKSPTVPPAPEGCDLIADEAHKLVSNRSATTLSFRMLSACVRKARGRVIGVTATPMAKHPPQLWSILTSLGIAKTAFDDYETFERLFGFARQRFGGDWLGPQSEEAKKEIAARLARVMLRRLRSESITLPPRTFITKSVEISASTARQCEGLMARLSRDGNDPWKTIEKALADRTSPAFNEIAQVRSILAAAKIDAMLEEVEAYEQAEEPLMVLSAHKAPIEALRNRPGWVVISGEEDADEKMEVATRFQTDTTLKGVAVSIAAGGVAITLHRAAHCLMVDQAYNPSANAQATDRIYRIGQGRSVFVKILVADHEIDRRVTEILREKTELFEGTVGQVELCTLHDECLQDPEHAKRCARERAISRGVEERLAEIEKSVPEVDFSALLSEAQAEAEAEKARQTQEEQKVQNKHESRRGRYVDDARTAEPRAAETDIEEWAALGLARLHAACDGVHAKDDVGFSVATRPVGSWLARELMVTDGRLTPAGWAAAVRVCLHHRHQLGGNPSK